MTKTMSDRPFKKLSDFPALLEVTRNYQTILDELDKSDIWMEWGSDDRDVQGHCRFLNGDWKICPVFFGNYDPLKMNMPQLNDEEKRQLIDQLPDIFPKTQALLKGNDRINYAALTRLFPHSKLDPHRHNNPYALIYHLGLIIPPNETCGITVGGETHFWSSPGDAIIFDDTFEHYAWNNSDQDRILFYINFAHETLADRVYNF